MIEPIETKCGERFSRPQARWTWDDRPPADELPAVLRKFANCALAWFSYCEVEKQGKVPSDALFPLRTGLRDRMAEIAAMDLPTDNQRTEWFVLRRQLACAYYRLGKDNVHSVELGTCQYCTGKYASD